MTETKKKGKKNKRKRKRRKKKSCEMQRRVNRVMERRAKWRWG